MNRPDWFPQTRPTGSPVKIPQIESSPEVPQICHGSPKVPLLFRFVKFLLNLYFKVPLNLSILKLLLNFDFKVPFKFRF